MKKELNWQRRDAREGELESQKDMREIERDRRIDINSRDYKECERDYKRFVRQGRTHQAEVTKAVMESTDRTYRNAKAGIERIYQQFTVTSKRRVKLLEQLLEEYQNILRIIQEDKEAEMWAYSVSLPRNERQELGFDGMQMDKQQAKRNKAKETAFIRYHVFVDEKEDDNLINDKCLALCFQSYIKNIQVDFLNWLDFSSRKDYYEECLKIIKIEFDPNSKEYKSTYSDNMGKYSESLKKEKEYGNKVMEFIKNIT